MLAARCRPPRPTGTQIYFIGATNVPLENLDPALTRPGRMGRHVTFRTPTKEDRKDIFDLYLDKVAHDPELDTPARRDEIARITNGYSPAMIDQICSMALTNAHHDGPRVFRLATDLVDAMTVIESGTAIDVNYTEDDARAVAIHEAGHAAAAHVYRPELESSRLSIRMRGGSLGHHQFFEKEERFGAFQSRALGDLIHTRRRDGGRARLLRRELGRRRRRPAVGDLARGRAWSARRACRRCRSTSTARRSPTRTRTQTRERVLKRFEDIGVRLLNRERGGGMMGDPIAAVLSDPRKRTYAAQFLGQAFVTAYNLIRENKDKVETVANAVIEKKEIYGDDLVRLLDAQAFEKPEIDWTDEKRRGRRS